MNHRPTFRRKAEIQYQLDSTLIALNDWRSRAIRSEAKVNSLVKENVELKTLRTELEGQVQVQSTLVTNARVAAQESHKGYDTMKRQYQSAYERGTELQEKLYFLQGIIDQMKRDRWSAKARRWLRGLFNA